MTCESGYYIPSDTNGCYSAARAWIMDIPEIASYNLPTKQGKHICICSSALPRKYARFEVQNLMNIFKGWVLLSSRYIQGETRKQLTFCRGHCQENMGISVRSDAYKTIKDTKGISRPYYIDISFYTICIASVYWYVTMKSKLWFCINIYNILFCEG